MTDETDAPLEQAHWKTLQMRVVAAGGQYESKEQAIEFLRALDMDRPAAVPVAGAVDMISGGQLDESRPFGEIFGEVDGAPGAKFSQDGCYFDVHGNKVG